MNRAYLLNASTIKFGGGLQAVISFIRYLVTSGQADEWSCIVSKQIKEQMDVGSFLTDQLCVYVMDSSPARSREARRTLLELEADLSPSAVFTFFGPAYVKFSAPHLCGVADGWVTHSSFASFHLMRGPLRRLTMALMCIYKGYWYRFADRWYVEEESARSGLHRRLRIPRKNIDVVPNNCALHYVNARHGPFYIEDNIEVRVLSFASYYRHKHLEIIPDVAAAVREIAPTLHFEFIITIEKESEAAIRLQAKAESLGVSEYVRNIGPVKIMDGPALYRSCDVLFHPSLLETFSATYPEAMVMGLPIVASDLPFARAICGDAAVYFSPLDARDAAEKVSEVAKNVELRTRLTRRGDRRQQSLPSAEQRYGRLVDIMHQLTD